MYLGLSDGLNMRNEQIEISRMNTERLWRDQSHLHEDFMFIFSGSFDIMGLFCFFLFVFFFFLTDCSCLKKLWN